MDFLQAKRVTLSSRWATLARGQSPSYPKDLPKGTHLYGSFGRAARFFFFLKTYERMPGKWEEEDGFTSMPLTPSVKLG